MSQILIIVPLLCCILFAIQCHAHTSSSSSSTWNDWIANYGHDVYQYPHWIQTQMDQCTCTVDVVPNGHGGSKRSVHCTPDDAPPASVQELTFCYAKKWLLERMPEFDLHYLPPAVSVTGESMLDDTIAFSMMTAKAARWAPELPVPIFLTYVLPYASYHESRVNWRPQFFARFFSVVANSPSTHNAMTALVTPFWSPTQSPTFLNWSAHVWPAYPVQPPPYHLQWASSTSPPNISPFDFASNGYGSCTAWSTMLTYVARAMGIPARQVGTPCWNNGPFAGLAVNNPNVSQCWAGGNGTSTGGLFLNNHNWVEYWNSETGEWVFINVPPSTAEPNQGLCNSYDPAHGCNWDANTLCQQTSGPGAAMRDHEIFSVSWALPEDEVVNGGPLVDVKSLRLSNNESVSPLVWSPRLKAPSGKVLKDVGLRVINRTDFYRCR